MQPKWTPPLLNKWDKALIQERYWPDRWKMLTCCVLLNLTRRVQVEKIIHTLFNKYPNPKGMAEANEDELRSIIQDLGMANKRSKTLIRMSKEYISGNWKNAIDLHGIGKYGSDSDRMFYLGEWRSVEPKDGALVGYKKFLESYYSVYT